MVSDSIGKSIVKVNTTDFIADSEYYAFGLNQFFQFFYYCIDFFFCVVFAERKTYRHQVGVIIDGPDYMGSLVGATTAGTTT
jgi:hypothetical protein